MQSSSSNRPFKPNLAGASPATDAMLSRCNQFLHAALRRRRFVVQIHVRAPVSMPLCLQQLQGEFRKLVFVGASPTRGSSLRLPATACRVFHGGHGVTAALCPVTALVSVEIRLATPISMGRSLWIIARKTKPNADVVQLR